jgi:hypothetical protein
MAHVEHDRDICDLIYAHLLKLKLPDLKQQYRRGIFVGRLYNLINTDETALFDTR